jgi:hypothetical protein
MLYIYYTANYCPTTAMYLNLTQTGKTSAALTSKIFCHFIHCFNIIKIALITSVSFCCLFQTEFYRTWNYMRAITLLAESLLLIFNRKTLRHLGKFAFRLGDCNIKLKSLLSAEGERGSW